MALYAISDLHLSLSADKPMDVFRGWDNYVDRLKANWNRLITDDDTVVIPGDISWCMHLNDAVLDFEFINSLPGKKIMLKGNHDLWWSTSKKLNTFLEENNFDSISFVFNNAICAEDKAICGTRGWFYDEEEPDNAKILAREAGRLATSIAAAKQTGATPVVFLHYPPIFDGRECTELLEVLKRENITRCYYGHVHSAGIRVAFQGEWEGIEFRLISGDSLGFCPLHISFS